MTRRYAVDGVRDDQGALLNTLHEIAGGGGRVVSVTWQPERYSKLPNGGTNLSAGYTVVSEYDLPDA
jgi:hypothetical protein